MNRNVGTIPRSFYEEDPARVAEKLLGKSLVRIIDNQMVSGIIVETEAYLAFGDAAAHSFRGKSRRNESLFGEAGHTYVHSMRQYHCVDIVTEGSDRPGSVLIRALEPTEGIDTMRRLRSTDEISNLTSGPGKLCQALQIDRSLNGVDVTSNLSLLYVTTSELGIAPQDIVRSPRVGISASQDALLRFTISGNPFISKPAPRST